MVREDFSTLGRGTPNSISQPKWGGLGICFPKVCKAGWGLGWTEMCVGCIIFKQKIFFLVLCELCTMCFDLIYPPFSLVLYLFLHSFAHSSIISLDHTLPSRTVLYLLPNIHTFVSFREE